MRCVCVGVAGSGAEMLAEQSFRTLRVACLIKAHRGAEPVGGGGRQRIVHCGVAPEAAAATLHRSRAGRHRDRRLTGQNAHSLAPDLRRSRRA